MEIKDMKKNISNTNNIEKPISLIIKEAKSAIVDAINSVQLHPVLLEMIINELYLEVQEQAIITYKKENNDYFCVYCYFSNWNCSRIKL